MTRKLSKTQERIVELMGHGWELGFSHGIQPYVSLQKGGIGRGGQTETVSIATFMRLRDLGVIWAPNGDTFPTDRYQLMPGDPPTTRS